MQSDIDMKRRRRIHSFPLVGLPGVNKVLVEPAERRLVYE
jgi:hypothetical protein